MNNTQLVTALTNLGLSKNEASVYIAILSLGQAKVSDISSASHIKRTSVYPLLNSLVKKGVVSIVIIGIKHLYVAENPKHFENLLEEHKKTWNDTLPNFLNLYNSFESSDTIKIFKGLESVKTMYKSLLPELRPRDDYYVISDTKKWLSLGDFFLEYSKKRAKLNLNLKIISIENEVSEYYKKYEKNYSSQVKLIKNTIDFTTSLTITPSKMILLQMSPVVSAIIIENKSMVEMQRQMFNLLWENTK